MPRRRFGQAVGLTPVDDHLRVRDIASEIHAKDVMILRVAHLGRIQLADAEDVRALIIRTGFPEHRLPGACRVESANLRDEHLPAFGDDDFVGDFGDPEIVGQFDYRLPLGGRFGPRKSHRALLSWLAV